MLKKIMGTLVCLAGILAGSAVAEETLWHPSHDSAWEMKFEDTFEGTEVDAAKWFPGYRLGRVEYYTRIGFPNEHVRGWQPNPPLAHYVLSDGILKLRVDENEPKRDTPTVKTASCLTSAIYRYDEATKTFPNEVKFAQKYGWWEIRCRMPKGGSGAYTAFWLHSVGAENQEYTPEGVRQGNPTGSSPAKEIDIFEWLCRDPKTIQFHIHFTEKGHHYFPTPEDITENFHTWAIHWEEGRITWFLDGKPIWTYEGATPANEMYLLMCMFQIGGWVGPIDPNLPYPMDFEVDYVRVWKKK